VADRQRRAPALNEGIAAGPQPIREPQDAGVSPLLPHPITGQEFPSPVPPGTGWPDDPATEPDTGARTELGRLSAEISVCRACPRLVRWREDVARLKRAAFADQPYWGRPIRRAC